MKRLLSFSVFVFVLFVAIFKGGESLSTILKPENVAVNSAEFQRSRGVSRMLLGAFNMKKFGLPKVGNVSLLETIVKIITRYDLVALSEITDRTENAIKRLVERVNFVSRRPYHYIVSERVGRTNNKEQYALIFRPDLANVMKHFLYNDSARDAFAREPHIALVTFLGYDQQVAIVNIHVKPTDAVAEIDALTDIHSWLEQRLKIKDVIMLGDFNADCGYVAKKAWKSIRLRNMERFNWLIGDEVDTTVGKTNCAYDRIVVTGSFFKERVISGTAQAFRFDTILGLVETNALQVSDHYPVEVAISLPGIRILTDMVLANDGINDMNMSNSKDNVSHPIISVQDENRKEEEHTNTSLITKEVDSVSQVGNSTTGSETKSRWTKFIPDWAKKMIRKWF